MYLAHDNGHLAVVRAGGETLIGAGAGGVANDGLRGEVVLLTIGLVAATTEEATATATEQTTEEVAELALAGLAPVLAGLIEGAEVVLNTDRVLGTAVGGGGAGAHESLDHDRGVDGAVALGAAEGADLTGLDLGVTDDGGISLGAAAVGAAVARSAISD